MARERLPMSRVREILRLRFSCRLSRNAIARSTGRGRSTVSEYIGAAEKAGLTNWAAIDAMADDEIERRLGLSPDPADSGAKAVQAGDPTRPLPDFEKVHAELSKKGVTLALLWQEYRAIHASGYRYTQFCEYYHRWRKKLSVVMRQTHRAGEKVFVDYSGDGLFITDPRTGQKIKTELFVSALGASSYTFAEATMTQQLPDWLMSHARMFEFFGGVPAVVVPDNLRSGVRSACYYEPEINLSYQDLAGHYGTCILPARVRKPRDKAKAEVAVQVAQRWIVAKLRNRTFYSLAELNAAIRECLEIINGRRMRHVGKSRRELFEQLDRPALASLPPQPYEFAEWKKARVNIDYHVEFGRHYYSAPYQLVGQEVFLRVTQSAVEVLLKGRRVASHARSFVRGAYTTDAAHRPASHRAHAEWRPSRMIAWAKKEAGAATGELVKRLLADKPHPEQGYRSVLGIMRLAQRYGPNRLEKAAAKALAMNSASYRTIKSMLKNKMESAPLARPEESKHDEQLALLGQSNIRGKNYFH